ncbi:hypothetical protein GCM10014713_07710 [Streptomyces purpureus]|uniref:Uncharacterized protein n=1 Tax=Streptomyces purpureus TaxID=1951 RepID=A0A918LM65_9ACTN|nr:hypothetical protein GCM10014713_07710 [Streptomyces purpureus]
MLVERLPGLEAVMQLAEEAVEQVALGGVVPVAVLTAAAVVGLAPGEALRAEKTQRKPACMSRLFLMKRWPTKHFLPKAR